MRTSNGKLGMNDVRFSIHIAVAVSVGNIRLLSARWSIVRLPLRRVFFKMALLVTHSDVRDDSR